MVACDEWICRNFPMLSGEVADLAGLRETGVAAGSLAADVGVEVAESVGAISVSGDWEGVNVVYWVNVRAILEINNEMWGWLFGERGGGR